MARKLIVPQGAKFGRLTVVEEAERYMHKGKTPYRRFRCVCDCGRSTTARLSNLRSGVVTSCGCTRVLKSGSEKVIARYEKSRGRKIPGAIRNDKMAMLTHSRWSDMKKRCYCKRSKDFHLYGGRGIAVCDEWLDDFWAFHNWAISNGFSRELQIDRIDCNGNYSPANCRFVTSVEQTRNRRNTRWITLNGETKTLMQWCEEYGMNYYLVHGRLRNNWDVERALTETARRCGVSH